MEAQFNSLRLRATLSLERSLCHASLTALIFFFFAFVAIFTCSRHVILPKQLAELVPRTHLMTESEWRNLGVQQSPGWTHYLIHEPGKRSSQTH